MKRPKGPQVKMPDLKVPAVIADLYYDLRDRRLLPLIALVGVAIVATPFLLGQSSEVTEPPPTSAAIQALKEAGGERTATLTVVEAKPGLRDYRRRLRSRKPLDPFRSFGKPSLKGAQLGKGSGKEGGSGSSAPVTSTSTTVKETKEGSKTTTTTTDGTGDGGNGGPKVGGDPKDGGGDPKDGGGDPKDGGGTQMATYTIDVQISTADETGGSVEPVERRGVKPGTALPGKDTPVVTYLGVGSGGAKALFSVSREVSSVFGEAKCVSGTDTCDAIELERDFPVTFIYGGNQARYRIKLLDIKRAKDDDS